MTLDSRPATRQNAVILGTFDQQRPNETSLMSETATAETEQHATTTVDEPFGREEIKEFSNDDVEAGRNICKMLSLFFFYTVIVMGLSTYVTYRWVMGG